MIRLGSGLGHGIVDLGVQSRKGAEVPPGGTRRNADLFGRTWKVLGLDLENSVSSTHGGRILPQGTSNAPNRCLPRDPGGRRCGVNVAEVVFPFGRRRHNARLEPRHCWHLLVPTDSQGATTILSVVAVCCARGFIVLSRDGKQIRL